MDIKSVLFLSTLLLSAGLFAEEDKPDTAKATIETSLKPSLLPIGAPLSAFAFNGTRQSPEAMKQAMDKAMELQNQQRKARIKSLMEPELARLIAQFKRVYYDELISQGFTEEQALKIIINHHMPAMY